MGYTSTVDVDVNMSGTLYEAPDGALDDLLGALNVVELEVERVYGSGGSTASLDVIFPDGAVLSHFERLSHTGEYTGEPHYPVENYAKYCDYIVHRNSNITITIDVSVTYPGATEESVTERIFTGEPTRISQKEDGVVTIEALDKRKLLNEKMVRLDTRGSPETSKAIIDDLLGNELGMAKGEDYVLNYGDPIDISIGYGTSEGIPLYRILTDIASREDVHFWITGENVLRFDKFPQSDFYTLNTITGLEAGSDDDPQNVIVESPHDSTGLSMFQSTGTQSTQSEAGFEDTDDRRRLSDPNVTDVESAQRSAFNAFQTEYLKKNSGTVTIVGAPKIQPYDQVTLTDLPPWTPIAEGEYSVKTVKHVMGQRDGYVTELEIGGSLPELLDQMTGTHRDAIEESEEIDEYTFWQKFELASSNSTGEPEIVVFDGDLNPLE